MYSVRTICALLTICSAQFAWCDVKMPEGEQLPIQVYKRGVEPVRVWVTYGEGLRPRAMPWKNVAVPRSETFTFLSDHFVAAEPGGKDILTRKDAEGNSYHLLVRTDPTGSSIRKYLGWVDRRYLLTGQTALRDDKTNIFRKAMIINRVDDKDLNPLEGVQVRHAPRKSSKPKEQFKLFQLYFIYGMSGEGGDGFVLLGSKFSFADPEGVVLGWVPANRICCWDTRQALDWNTESTLQTAEPRRTKPGVIWSSPRIAAMNPPDAPSSGNEGVLYREHFEKGVSRPLPFDMMRFPVLEPTPEMRQFEQGRPGGWRLQRIGAIGDFLDETTGAKIASVEKILDYQRILSSIEPKMVRTEILFILDDTEGMERWFTAAASAVEAMVARISIAQPDELRLAVAFYNDTPPSKPNAAYCTTMPLKNALRGDTEVIDKLRDHTPTGGDDPRERVFDGIKAAIDDAGFSQLARKLVVVMGDMGDKSDENDPVPAAQLVEKLFPSGESPIEIVALHVLPPAVIAQNRDAKAFEIQMRRVVQLASERAEKENREYRAQSEAEEDNAHYLAQYGLVRDEVALTKLITDRHNQLRKNAEQIRDQIDALRRGSWGLTAIGPELRRILQTKGHDLRTLETKGVQLFQEGFVWVNTLRNTESISSTRMKLLLDEDELYKISWGLDAFVAPFANAADERDIEKLRRHAINAMVGQLGDPRDSADDIREKLKALDVRSAFLSADEEVRRPPSEWWKEVERLRHVRDRIEGIRNNMKHTYSAEERLVGGSIPVRRWYRVGEPEKDPRAFHLGGDLTRWWYWVDQDTEWP